ncbi:4-hydroxy-3-methylbut-2-enyl diphosphate reductase [Sphingomonas sp. AAP5]|uniref:4-hydroxy-3-methylbut-2-enyl diphosphate reductase n=1 Tax=Sphingomonas glacialis TaxID=658225 RepID=A0ABQ3LGC2_9SPHN|nr:MULTISPECIES: 4-hydroxy-3-methylbut-2-enyl diphosphate reductase [Sphingomonas]QBM76311.1 4-hydroxy-3-methylbut-2-enyl diphosphate reductase [Sphingomonas sp. AAP5]GHH12044.1 4-hydroxy-3-methylbut-2-enyl diphosphate reductase 2 [Sphingomonas glacialis]
MQVILANPRGFCAGVVRAIEIVERAIDRYGAPVYVRHEIVHNRHVVDTLRAKGAVFVEELSDVPEGAMTVFSAHGVARSVEDEAKARKLPVFDATCPLVTKVHLQGRRYAKDGRTLVMIGHEGHAEVVGTRGQVDAPVHLVSTEADVAALDLPTDTPMAYITQTTLSVDDTKNVIASLGERFTNLIGPDVSEICYATQNRQSAVRDLCKVADLILVVGSENSSNSSRLRDLGADEGLPSYLVADGSAIDPAWFEGIERVGLTAGASAPDELVESVIAALRKLGPVEVTQLSGVVESLEFGLPRELRDPAPTKRAAVGA